MYAHNRTQVSTTRLATEDLDKYHRALERALLTFHTSKMADINKVGGCDCVCGLCCVWFVCMGIGSAVDGGLLHGLKSRT